MTDGAYTKEQIDRTELPGWVRLCMALVGGILLLAPMLVVVWPR